MGLEAGPGQDPGHKQGRSDAGAAGQLPCTPDASRGPQVLPQFDLKSLRESCKAMTWGPPALAFVL